MSIVVKCGCGRTYELTDESAGRTIRCLSCRRPVTVPATARPKLPPAAAATDVRAAPADAQHGPGSAASPSEFPGEVPSVKRGFNLTDLAMIGGGVLMAAALLWYFIGYRLFGGERLYPAGILLVTGLSFMLSNIARDMQE
jgi:hypothetical protein